MKNFEVKMNNETFVMSAENREILDSILAQSSIAYEIREILAKKKSKVQFAENGNGVCIHCHTKFDYDSLNDDDKSLVDKYGLCPACAHKYEEGQSIKQSMKVNGITTRKTPSIRTGQKPGEVIRNLIKNSEHLLNAAIIDELNDATKMMKLAFPLFKMIPEGATENEIKELKKDTHGRSRYSNMSITVDGNKYLITNDLYDKNVTPITDMFASLGLIDINED